MIVAGVVWVMVSSGSSAGVYIPMISGHDSFLIWADQYGAAWVVQVELGAAPACL